MLAEGNLFARSRNIKQMSLPEAIYYVFEAKKVSERSRHVGSRTNMVIITQADGVRFLTPEDIKVLEDIYENKQPPAFSKDDTNTIEARLSTFQAPPTTT